MRCGPPYNWCLPVARPVKILGALLDQVRSSIVRDIGLLTISGAAGQILNFAAYPVLTRLYAPSDFGVFATYIAIASVIGSILCLRLEIVLQIAPHDEDSDIIRTAGIVAVSISAMLFIFLFIGMEVFGDAFTLLNSRENDFILLVLGLSFISVLNGVFLIGRQYSAKNQRYRRIALAQISRSAIMIFCQMAFAYILSGPAGLIGGFIAGLASAVILLWPFSWSVQGWRFPEPFALLKTVTVILKRYRSLIAIDTLNVLISASAQVAYPLIALASYGAEQAGLLALATRLTFISIDILAAAISTVYFQRLSQAIRSGVRISLLLQRTFLLGLGIGLVIATVLVLTVDPFLQLLFDRRWWGVGELVLCLLPTFIVRFSIGCVGSTPLAIKRPRLIFGWNGAQCVILLASFLIALDWRIEAFLLLSGVGLLAAGSVYIFVLIFAVSRWESKSSVVKEEIQYN